MSTEHEVVYLLLPGVEPDAEDPVAAFSDKQTIDRLVEKLSRFEGGASVKMVLATENTLPVDKYASLVKAGLLPYSVVLNGDGYLFDNPNILGADLEEKTLEQDVDYVLRTRTAKIKDPAKQWGMGGTFWAPDSKLAFKQARLRHKIIYKALVLQEMDEIVSWLEHMLSSDDSEQFLKKTGQTPEQIEQRLSFLDAKAKLSFKHAAVKDLQFLRYKYEQS
ncbi:hypothetical protein [Dyadobacter alkalitolerans]|uniref:hypothetical protein n=1 Tax=Dyadobacter alkalitolerans TaxID=492736 RepID=UPI000408C1F6|nr:hypothetical protein [Dyadobacter alkalitolerans]